MSTPLHELCDIAATFYQKGLAFGSTGNLSVRVGEEIWVTPTGQALRDLTPDDLACIDEQGVARNDRKASKEFPFHLAAYRAAGDRAHAIVHLHAHYTVALSCLQDLPDTDPLPPITPYYLMRVAPLRVLPYFRPGSQELADAVGEAAADHDCLLLRNHGAICLGDTLSEAADRMEELEETARLFFTLEGRQLRTLTESEQEEIWATFRAKA
ncbi:MAG TPA: class II aldolase/adducin family protein [Bryobacteraceae bacterium]|nr:class II aldolase/adducin family protein [Bryobacteraceae bacterium]